LSWFSLPQEQGSREKGWRGLYEYRDTPDFLFYSLNLPFMDALRFLQSICIFPSSWLVLCPDFVTGKPCVDVIGNLCSRGSSVDICRLQVWVWQWVGWLMRDQRVAWWLRLLGTLFQRQAIRDWPPNSPKTDGPPVDIKNLKTTCVLRLGGALALWAGCSNRQCQPRGSSWPSSRCA